MARKKRLYRIAVIPAALVAVGVAGATLSQADASQTTSCSGSGLLSVVTSTLCAATTGVGNLLGGATGGATTPVTSAVTSVGNAATGAVSSVTGGQQSTASSSGSSSSGSSSSGSSSGSTGSTGSTGSAGGTVGTGSTGTTVSQPRSATAPSAAAARAAALAAQRAAQVQRQQSLLAIPVKAASGQATSVQLGSSQTTAYRQASASHPSLWRATPLSLLIAIAIGLVVGIGIVYAGWRNGDLFGRRKRRPAPRRYPGRPAEGTLVR